MEKLIISLLAVMMTLVTGFFLILFVLLVASLAGIGKLYSIIGTVLLLIFTFRRLFRFFRSLFLGLSVRIAGLERAAAKRITEGKDDDDGEDSESLWFDSPAGITLDFIFSQESP